MFIRLLIILLYLPEKRRWYRIQGKPIMDLLRLVVYFRYFEACSDDSHMKLSEGTELLIKKTLQRRRIIQGNQGLHK